MDNKTIFHVRDVFFLKDGKVVFAGDYASGSKEFGDYSLIVGGKIIKTISVTGEMLFPSKGTTDIALYTYDAFGKELIDISKEVYLILV
ncbi:hypothetical protein [Acinetobacter modestus]|uniref:hypothetical protein n=1 Tax=Acinetobacter modestus TaxID=1776740 RepID=UPI001F4ABE06|nr:hypothetical protein [Acinetobacter modestus]MCH7333221.1 hypothetical protein [Acinetobacter modestus]